MNTNIEKNIKYRIATGFGLGELAWAPGTWGTFGGVVLYLLLLPFSWPVYLSATTAAFVFGCWLCEKVSEEMKVYDHKSVVWDEIVGYCVAMMGVPYGIGWMCAGFILFRILDITKPWPINWVDARMKNGLGMMLDDLLAGAAVCVILQVYAYL